MKPKCCFCEEAEEHIATNGPKGTKLVQYFACQKYVEMAPKDRFQELKNKGYCFKYLFSGVSQDKEKHHDGMCQEDFMCKHKSHDRYPINQHMLVCHEHRNETENQELLQKYKDRFIMKQPNQFPSFSRDLELSFHMNQNQSPNFEDADQERAIYILQTVKLEQHEYLLFHDTGCCDMVSRYAAIKSVGKRASKEFFGPITLGGVGNAPITSSHGTYQVKLPQFNGNYAVVSGVCFDQITVEFPKYSLKGLVEADVRSGYISNGKDPKYLPKLPAFVGGHSNFMIGLKYLRYYPKKVFQLPSGLTIYKS